ncbi:TetR/AcrR family transcriptional regulator [Clostridium sp. ZBS15]|uniref:TetR/AcrR family transcriptional regulator n=1 Tax=Clostridium sp. ZBS15 TaxID=2949969 RepID=UPI00207AB77D|nr:TetR/AcrR family transcriptional regulator [Clostridium sp. ZBS15]
MYNDILKRKEKIIITAIDLLDEAGILGLTTKEIAKRQKITEPAIYRQFDSKKDIVISIIDRYAEYDAGIQSTILDNEMGSKQGILYFTSTYAEYYQNYPEITTVAFSFDVFRYDKELNEKMCRIVNGRYSLLLELVAKGIEGGEISSQFDSVTITDAIFSTIWSITFLWKINQYNFELKERMINVIENILRYE